MTDRQMDNALRAWAQADFEQLAGDSAAADRIIQHANRISAAAATPPQTVRKRPWWWASGAVATLAVALLVGTQAPHMRQLQPAAQSQTDALAAGDDSDLMSFAMLYTPTSEEEYQL